MPQPDPPIHTVVVEWEDRTLLYRNREGENVRVTIPAPERPGADLFLFCCSVAVAQELAIGAGARWSGASHGFLNAVARVFGWKLGRSTREKYWERLAAGQHGDRLLSRIEIVGREGRRGKGKARELFTKASGFVLGDPDIGNDGELKVWSIHFVVPAAQQREYAAFRSKVEGCLDPCILSLERAGPDAQPLSVAASPTLVPAPIADRYYRFDAFIEERTRGFVGRESVFAALRRFLSRQDVRSGYFVIRGEPGIGKSTLAAEVVKRFGCTVHHFNSALQAIDTPRQFLENVCARLIGEHALPYRALPEGFDSDGVFFNRLLAESARAYAPLSPLLVLIDALDEVNEQDVPGASNALFLPPSLPDHVYIVVTTRPLERLRLQATHTEIHDLVAMSSDNLADAEAYITSRLRNEGVRRWLRAQRLSPQKLVTSLISKSRGNFMYLHHVLPAIERGDYEDDGIEGLPEGLLEYYRGHWARMRRAGERFGGEAGLIVCVLAAAMEPVSIEQISLWTGIDRARVTRVIRDWLEFLQPTRDPDGRPAYRLYHATFRDFLEEEVDPGLRSYHALIAESVLRRARGQQSPAPPRT